MSLLELSRRRKQYRVPLESATIVGVSKLGESSLYAVRRKSGEILEGVSGPSGKEAGEGILLGFSDSSAGQRYRPVYLSTTTYSSAIESLTQNSSFPPRVRPHWHFSGFSGTPRTYYQYTHYYDTLSYFIDPWLPFYPNSAFVSFNEHNDIFVTETFWKEQNGELVIDYQVFHDYSVIYYNAYSEVNALGDYTSSRPSFVQEDFDEFLPPGVLTVVTEDYKVFNINYRWRQTVHTWYANGSESFTEEVKAITAFPTATWDWY